MPGGRRMRSRGSGILRIPRVSRAPRKEPAKKSKYLKIPRIMKFKTSEKINHLLRWESERLGAIFCAIRKSTVVLPIMRARKRQSHHPKKSNLPGEGKKFGDG